MLTRADLQGRVQIINGREYWVIDPGDLIDVPESIAVCPYCGAALYVQFEEWEQLLDQSWQVSDTGAKAECESEPELATHEEHVYDEWMKRHTYMPYVYWLPVEVKVTTWLQAKFRFAME